MPCATNTGRPTRPGALDRGSVGREPPATGDEDRHGDGRAYRNGPAGQACGPDTDGIWYDEVRVGLARGTETVDEVPGDADIATWTFTIDLAIDEDGNLDQRGPFVLGPRGERYLGLRWLRTDADGRPAVFRGAKFRLFEMDRALFEDALGDGRRLVGRLGLTDEQGWPRCATVRPPVISWTVT